MKLPELLANFRAMNAALPTLKEEHINELLAMEISSIKPRKLVLERLHQRYCILRARRERRNIMKECKL